jgi:Tfp pilus assembly ATPase PilU
MQSLDQDLQRVVQQGNVDRNDAAKIADNPDIFEKGVF